MLKRNVLLLMFVIPLFATGCFKKPASDISAKQADVPVVPVYNGVTDSYLVADGSCAGNTAIIFTYSSSLTSARTIEANCTNDHVTVNLPVDSGQSNQIIKMAVVGRLQTKKSSPVSASLNFFPLPKPLPGYTMAIVGPKNEVAGSQYQANANMSTFAIGGEPFAGQFQNLVPTGEILRTGLSGVIDP